MDRIQLYSISKVYREKEDSIPIISLNNVTISFSTKKIYAIMGPSGSGKSTLNLLNLEIESSVLFSSPTTYCQNIQ